MARPISILEVTDEERCELQRRVRAPSTAKRDHVRAQIISLRSEGLSQKEVAARLRLNTVLVNRWRRRFETAGLEGLQDQAGRGRKATVPPHKVEQIIGEAGRSRPGGGRWSTRTMAQKAGVSHATIHRLWRHNDLKPHLRRTFKLSNDACFIEKFWDVIGLYLNPPERALVLCCDEKSQCQALERTQPGLPLGIGHIRTQTHDYIRHGTVTLFAALNYLDGKLITRLEQRHTHVEWLRFLKQLDRETPKAKDLDLHLIVDNYCTHKHRNVRQWLDKHPRFHDLCNAVAALSQTRMVFAPAEDGGYVLVGASTFPDEVFQNIAWGGTTVMSDTRQRLRGAGWAFGRDWTELDTHWDIDRPADLRRAVAAGLLDASCGAEVPAECVHPLET